MMGGKRSSEDVCTPMLKPGAEQVLRQGSPVADEAVAKHGTNRFTPTSHSSMHRSYRQRRSIMLFERASNRWWNPQFASPVLERQYWKNTFPILRGRFRWGLAYLILTTTAWFCFHLATSTWTDTMVFQYSSIAIVAVLCCVLGFTFSQRYSRFYLPTSFIVMFFICVLSLLFCTIHPPILSNVGAFVMSAEVVLALYTIIPLPLYISILAGTIYSILFEVISMQRIPVDMPGVKLLLHLCIHMLGVHVGIISQVRERKTLLRISESLMARRDLEIEKQLKENMIASVMPHKVAEELLQAENTDRRASTAQEREQNMQPPRKATVGHKVFRNFVMQTMEDVSILFADIVGFTNMSSKVSSEELIDLLNDLFGRFDILCTRTGCEKISTLGDCYYCVSGCPEARPDHARCCVEMGLGMIIAIGQFDRDRAQEVNMRVGIHTGGVMCGLVGTHRFKFDVFSNDVTLANEMESSGRAGSVHITGETANFLDDKYELEPSDDYKNHQTFFVSGRRESALSVKRMVSGQLSLTTRSGMFGSKTPLTAGSGSMPIDHRHTRSVPVGPTGSASEFESVGASALPQHVMLHSDIRHIDSSDIDTAEGQGSGLLGGVLNGGGNVHAKMHTVNSNGSKHSSDSKSSGKNGSNSKDSRISKDTTPKNSVGGVPRSDPPGSVEDARRSTSIRSMGALRMAETGEEAAEYVSSDSMRQGGSSGGRQPAAMESVISFTRVDDRTDRRLADALAAEKRPLLLHASEINPWTLKFRSAEVERLYHRHFAGAEGTAYADKVTAPKFAVSIDVAISTGVFLVCSVVAWMQFGARSIPWIAFFACATPLLLLFLGYVLHSLLRKHRLPVLLTNRFARHIVALALILVSGLFAALLHYCNGRGTTVMRDDHCSIDDHLALLYLLYTVMLAHVNFSHVNYLVKTGSSLVVGTLVLALALTLQWPCPPNTNPVVATNGTSRHFFNSPDCLYQYESIVAVLLVLVLAVFLNRQFERIYRMSFYGDVQSVKDINDMIAVKEQADWLLANIIPDFVMEKLKTTSKYSENHSEVAVVFASIINWDEIYEEQFAGGREFLRVLNEIMGDFDELLDQPQFSHVEKIKTIGATYMAAAGLNPQRRKAAADPMEHVDQLVNFALSLQAALNNFNQDMLNFDFVMKIGFNVGPVTAGVIGTTKLYYDIWGDTVNIASRMYSTGLHGRIQVSERVKRMLEDRYDFEFRDHIEVKGIDGGMNVYLVVGHRFNK